MAKLSILGAAFALALPIAASATTITFDNAPAPYQFADARPLTLQYGALGVAFGGNGAVLDETVADFVTGGGSGSNVLGYANASPFGGTTRETHTYDTIRFSVPQTTVSFAVGSAFSALGLDVTLFDASGGWLGSQTIALTPSFSTVTLTGGFSSIAFNLVGAREGDAFAIDDLSFTAGPAILPAPEPAALGLLAIGVGSVLGLRRRVR